MSTQPSEESEVRIRMMDYVVHFRTDELRLSFEVFPVQDWEQFSTKIKGFSYINKETEPDTIEIFEDGKCLKKFEGLFCWRGVWEGRLYFTDVEYWGEEIAEMSELYNIHIVPWCKEYIKKRTPSNYYDK